MNFRNKVNSREQQNRKGMRGVALNASIATLISFVLALSLSTFCSTIAYADEASEEPIEQVNQDASAEPSGEKEASAPDPVEEGGSTSTVEPEQPAQQPSDSATMDAGEAAAISSDTGGQEKRDDISSAEVAQQASAEMLSANMALSVQANEAAEAHVISMRLMWKNPTTQQFEAFKVTSGKNTPASVLAAFEQIELDVELTYDDGTVKMASEAGVALTWKLSNEIQNGKTVAKITKDGKLSLSDSISKVVQVRAFVEDVEVDQGATYINLTADAAKPSSGKTIASAALTYQGASSGSSASSGAYDASKATKDTPVLLPIPTIEVKNGVLTMEARLIYINADGSLTQASKPDAQSNLIWQVVSFYDADHNRTYTLLADAQTFPSQKGAIQALGTGNGWAVVRCVSEAYPDFYGQEMLVRIVNNNPSNQAVVDANTVKNAQIVYYDEQSKSYVPYPTDADMSTSPTVINRPNDKVSFDVRLNFADGSNALASTRGVALDWRTSGMTNRKVPVATLSARGVLKALNVGNNYVRLTPQVMGLPTVPPTAYVPIRNNDPSITPFEQLTIVADAYYWVAGDQDPTDASKTWYWRPRPVSPPGASWLPLTTAGTGSNSSVQLTGAVRWSNTSITTSSARDNGERIWSLERCTDTKGNLTAPLVTISSDGVVQATGAGSGYAYIKGVVMLPRWASDGTQSYLEISNTVKIAVFANKKYAYDIRLLDESRKEIPTSALVLPSGKNTFQFYAKITYVEYNEATHSIDKKTVVVPYDELFVDGLEWGVYRTESHKEKEAYSSIDEFRGLFRAQSGFSRGYVYANLKGQSFTGGDLGAGVMLIAEDSTESLGQTNSMTVKIYHYSDYKNHGDSAPVARELTLTREELGLLANYTTWYTFQRRNNAFSTVYATGLSMRNLLVLCGVDPALLISMAFVGTDDYFAERHSADYILGTQYRYHYYYYRTTLPGLVQSETVAPMLALAYYMKNNAGYEDETDENNAGANGYNFMRIDSTLRVIFGMTGLGVRNANQSISKVNNIVIVVEDGTFPADPSEDDPAPPVKEEDDPVPPVKEDDDAPSKGEEGKQGEKNDDGSSNPDDGKGEYGVGTGIGSNVHNDGDDRKAGDTIAVGLNTDDTNENGSQDAVGEAESEEGAPKDNSESSEQSDKPKSEVDSSNEAPEVVAGDTIVQQAGSLYARELLKSNRMVIPPAELDRIWWVLVAIGALVAFLIGALVSKYHYTMDRLDGARIGSY